ncbi:hypothetical protein H2O64_08855 [Kordia sp. YSTF-M3]|uniref:Bacteriocin n=1 Tax=Kordia aestuariivivens TaxID=2759037 RepID=A0ABR7Q8L4_9FLAO|nr:hypothetical protein [Kordia aestuariivivens]MBC8754778.1 hypothetical protein [Kordia aestuariivivens]
MKKSILNVKGVQELDKNEQSKINGGVFGMQCYTHADCQILSSLPGMEYERFFCYWGYCQIA